MKAVVQVVDSATLCIDGKTISCISRGLCVYLGVEKGDAENDAAAIAKKIAGLRIFEDENKKMNLSAVQLNCEILLISQFTLLADVQKGNRPSFIMAEQPDKADILYNLVKETIAMSGVSVKTGVFGADMKITQQNCGPVTIILNCRDGKIF